ncbi:hypothetical protein DSO57_1010286 [Entomophthora muscae]|uniref:Uncharacterized protein n=1 Tax=Entomophthora muscae TaxID=34485 RepID=A0ACC2T7I4_9FUNG|nr:hypothetical protein DSO57_1010286 [Entomophthora muscae]
MKEIPAALPLSNVPPTQDFSKLGFIYITLLGLVNQVVPHTGSWRPLATAVNYLVCIVPIVYMAFQAQPASTVGAQSDSGYSLFKLTYGYKLEIATHNNLLYVKIPPGKPPTVGQAPALQHIRLKAKIAETKRLKAQNITSTKELLPINSPVCILSGNRKKLDSVHWGPGRVIKYRPEHNTYLVKLQGAKNPIIKKYYRTCLRLSKGEHSTRLVPTSKQLQEHKVAAVKTKAPRDVPE